MTPSTTHQPTLMQKLLGRNYKCWYLFAHSFKANTVNRLSMFSWFLSSLLFLFSNLIIWYANKNSGAYDFNYIFTYFIIGQIFILEGGVFYDLAEDISDGKLSNKLLVPSNIFMRYIIRDQGWNAFSRLIVQPLIYSIIALVFSSFIILPNFLNFIFFIFMIMISFIIFIISSIIIGSLAFWFPDAWGIIDLFRTIKDFTSGRYFPLNIFSFVYPLVFTPFAFTYFHVLEIYIGKYDTDQTLLVLAGGIAWCVVLYFLAKLVFKLGLKRNEAVGL